MIHTVLRVSGVVSILNCRQSVKLEKNWSIPTRAAVFPHETSVPFCTVKNVKCKNVKSKM